MAQRKKEIFVKVSGDVFQMPEFLQWVVGLSLDSLIVICVGGGTQINEEFARRGWANDNYGPLGREIQTGSEEYWVAKRILQKNKRTLENLLYGAGVSNFHVDIPMINIGKCFRHTNGDDYLVTAHQGFSKLYIVTLERRFEAKMRKFAHLKKIEIVAF
jgi:hypothetical protein